jgi:hypothetical protein
VWIFKGEVFEKVKEVIEAKEGEGAPETAAAVAQPAAAPSA